VRRAGQGAGSRPGRATAVGPGDRRDGQPLIFGWGRHLTRAEKQRYRERFVLAAGIFVFAVIALVIGIGALQQFYLKPRTTVASVNGVKIERRWYDKVVAYNRFVLQHDASDLQTMYQALTANQRANAAATATAGPERSATAVPAGSPTAETSGTPTPQPTPTFNPQEQATVSALTSQFTLDQERLQVAEQQTLDDLINTELMRQNASKLGITVTTDDAAAESKKTVDQLGGDTVFKQLLQSAHLSQSDFDRIQYDQALRAKYEAYFAAHPEAAPPASPTPTPSATATPAAPGPQPPTPTAVPTPTLPPGAQDLDRWLDEQKKSANIYKASFPLPGG